VRRGWKILITVSVLWGIGMVATFPRTIIDDSFITFRYAVNLAEHGQFVYNLNEEPVEGYTGVLYPVLLAGLVRAGIPIILASQLIGVASYFGTALVLLLLLRRVGVRFEVQAITIALYFFAPFLYWHAYAGLETLLYTLLVTLTALTLYVALTMPQRTTPQLAYLGSGLLVSLARPEGILLAVLGVFANAVGQRRVGTRYAMRFAALAILVFAAPFAAYFLWRWHYYGLFLPNTFYAKASHWNNATALDVSFFVAHYLWMPVTAVALLRALAGPDGAFISLLRSPGRQWRRTPMASLGMVYALFTMVVLAQYSRSSLIQTYSYRFLVQFYPMALAFWATAVEFVWRRAPAWPGARRVAPELVLVFALLAGQQIATDAEGLKSFRGEARAYGQLLRDEHMKAAAMVRAILPSTEWLAVVVDAGAHAFYSRLKTVDFGGLADKQVWHLSHRQKVGYLFAHNPGAVIVSGREELVQDPRLISPFGINFAQDRHFQDRYNLVRVFRTSAPNWQNYVTVCYIRKDLLTNGPGGEAAYSAKTSNSHRE